MAHKSGFVNIIGNPNVGKSTIMNSLVGEKISIITSKSQTTRHRIMGIVNGKDFQIVYSDTPGVLKPTYKLQESMMHFALSALEDADVILYVTDVYETFDKNIEFIERVKKSDAPVILILNKIDLSDQKNVTQLMEKWAETMPKADILEMSALEGYNIDILLKKIISYLPEGPEYFPKDQLTDRPERFFVSEIIREKILLHYKQEVPYSSQVVIEEFKELEKIIHINATIHVERDTQKAIVIGHKGQAIKRVGTEARQDIEVFFGKKVFIELFVKVSKDWRDKHNFLRNFGY